MRLTFTRRLSAAPAASLRERAVERVIPATLSGAGLAISTRCGQNFYNGSMLVSSDANITFTNVVKVNNQQITATVHVAGGTAAGPYDIRITNLAGTSNAIQLVIQ